MFRFCCVFVGPIHMWYVVKTDWKISFKLLQTAETWFIKAVCFFLLSGVASQWRAHFSDLDYSWPAASSGPLILDEFLNGHSAQVRDKVLDDTNSVLFYFCLFRSLWLCTVKTFWLQGHPVPEALSLFICSINITSGDMSSPLNM